MSLKFVLPSLSMSPSRRTLHCSYCLRPEQIDGPSPQSWKIINAHLRTNASTIPELVAELGKRRFGHIPRVGDSFCGGGSLPFEAARIGCEAYASDLNPVAALLTWAALNIIGGGSDVAKQVQEAQRQVFDAVDRQITEWGIEHREPAPETGRRWRADAYLYCAECECPECHWRIPLAPSWVVAEKTNVIVRLVPDSERKRFDFDVVENVTAEEHAAAVDAGTAKDSELVCPICREKHPERGTTPISAIRGDGRGTFGDSKSLLRGWDNRDVIPRTSDVFGERLYCVRWVDTWTEWVEDARGEMVEKTFTERHYLAPSLEDLEREQQVYSLLMQRFDEWQLKGYIPSRKIEPGAKTDEPIRTRGWTHWHHLFTPRQLLMYGLINEKCPNDRVSRVGVLLWINRCIDFNCRLSMWLPAQSGGIGGRGHVFANRAFPILVNFACTPSSTLPSLFVPVRGEAKLSGKSSVLPCDSRSIAEPMDIWITDPPYADAVNYHELSEFMLAWCEGQLRHLFDGWYADSKRALAVRGDADDFRRTMVESYSRLSEMMPENGLQVVMFTHQNAGVWADLALILWASGLRVSSAWCIATETDAGYKEGNYVQGTVLLILRKQTSTDTSFLDEVYQEVEAEVRRQLDSMKDLDDARDPNFSDTDYQLAAYIVAASTRSWPAGSVWTNTRRCSQLRRRTTCG